jgi:hypothetical protein
MSYDTLKSDYERWIEARETQGDPLVLDWAADTSVARTPEGERLKYRDPADYAVAVCTELDLATY